MIFEDLFTIVDEKWTFSENNYPILKKLPLKLVKHFGINHTIQHQIKAVNRIISLLEDEEHLPYDPHIPIEFPNKNEILEAVWRMQVNTVKLAQLAGITSKEIEEKITKWKNEGV